MVCRGGYYPPASIVTETSIVRADDIRPYKSSLSDIQLLLNIIQIDGQHPADALLLHGDAVEHVRLLHGAPAVGDDDKLGLG